MTEIVVDASVAVMWVVAEAYSESAALLLRGHTCHAPDHWLAEAVNAIWGKAYRGELTAADAEERAATLMRAPVANVPIAGLMRRALAISIAASVTIYDSLYLAVAERLDAQVVTADRILLRRLSAFPALQRLAFFIGDMAA